MAFKLEKNDLIGIITPSSKVMDLKELEKSVAFIEELGYKVKIYDGCYFEKQTDDHKAQEIKQAFCDEMVKAVICARGGYGAIKILDDLPYNIIESHNKIFAGSSDITSLLIIFNKMCNFKTFHSPMLLGDGKFTKESFEDFVKTANGEKTFIAPRDMYCVVRRGFARGYLWGGNLSTIVSLFGSYSSFYTPNNDIILFLEDINEPAYKVNRMLTQIFRNRRLARYVKGLVLGDFMNIDDEDYLHETFDEFSYKFNVPTVYGYNITHAPNSITVPIGQEAEFDASNGLIKFIGQ